MNVLIKKKSTWCVEGLVPSFESQERRGLLEVAKQSHPATGW